MPKSRVSSAYEANFREKLKSMGNPHFWQLLHLRDPKNFIFGTKTQLVWNLHQEMQILEQFSSEIHQKCVEERDRYLKRPNPLHQPEVTISTIVTSISRIFDSESENSANFRWFRPKFMEKIVKLNLWAEPRFQMTFKSTFHLFLLQNRIWLKEKQAELLANCIFDWVQLVVVQIWHLQKHLFSSEFVPKAGQFFGSELAMNECFFGRGDLVRALRRAPDEMNLFCFLQSNQDRNDIRFIIDHEFLEILPENFKNTLKNWLKTVKIASNRITDRKLREKETILRKLRPTEPLNFSELPPVLRELLAELLNNQYLRVLDGEWIGYIMEMVVELGTASVEKNDGIDEGKVEKFRRCVVSENPSLCSQLFHQLPGENSDELRVILAQFFRFCCKFTGNLMRYLFSTDWNEDGSRIVNISFIPNNLDCVEGYDHGEFPEKKEEYYGPEFLDNFDFDAYFDNPEDDGAVAREGSSQIAPTSSSSRRERILRKITAEWAEDEAELMDIGNNTRSRRHHTPEGSRIHSTSSRQNQKDRQESTRIRRHHTPEGSRISKNREEDTNRKEKIRRRHHTPAPPRISTPQQFFGESEEKLNILLTDNNSNQFVHEEVIFDLHPWILYNYPIIETVVNNETPDFVD